IREELVAALDSWASIPWRTRGFEPTRLRAVARAADPDPLRNRLRLALDGRDQTALAEMAPQDNIASLPPATAVALAAALWGLGKVDTAAMVLQQARRQHPDDLWVNHDLALCLLEIKPPRVEEAVRYLTTVVALRPRSPVAHLNLGVAHYRLGNFP